MDTLKFDLGLERENERRNEEGKSIPGSYGMCVEGLKIHSEDEWTDSAHGEGPAFEVVID